MSVHADLLIHATGIVPTIPVVIMKKNSLPEKNGSIPTTLKKISQIIRGPAD
jgi:hypothetical protein